MYLIHPMYKYIRKSIIYTNCNAKVFTTHIEMVDKYIYIKFRTTNLVHLKMLLF